MLNERSRVLLAFLIVCTVWGSTWLVIKIGLQTVPPFLAAGLRFTIASSILLLIVRFRGLQITWTPDARKIYATLGVLSFFIPFALAYWAQQYVPSGLSSILFAVYPFCVGIFSHLLLPDERLDIYKIIGIILAFSGIVIIFWEDVHLSDPRMLASMSAIVAGAAIQGFTLVVIKKYGEPVNSFVMNFVGMAIAAVLLLALSLAVEPIGAAVWTTTAVASILYLALIGSVLTFVSYFWLLKRIEAVYLSLTSFVNPIVAVILGAAVLGESLSAAVFAGAALVLLGIVAANGRSLYAKAQGAR